MNHTFISYSSTDRPFVKKIATQLRNLGVEVWLDVDDIIGDRPYWEEIQSGVEGCSHFIFVVSPDTIEPDCGAMDELYHAKSLRPTPQFIIIVAREVDYKAMPIIISPGRYQYHDFVNNDFENAFAKIAMIYGIDAPLAMATPTTDAEPQKVMELRGHDAWVVSVKYSPDGKTIATGSFDKTARLWHAHNGNYMGSLVGHDGEINEVAFHPDNGTLVTASHDGTARVWHIDTRKAIVKFEEHTNRVNSVFVSNGGRAVLTASNDQTVKWWYVRSGIEWKTYPHTDPVDCAVFSPNSKLIATGCNDMIVRIWDVARNTPQFELEGHELAVLGVAFSPNENTLVSTSLDRTTIVWDVEFGEILHRLEGHQSWVRRATFSPDGSLLVTAGNDGTARIWDVESGEQLHVIAPFGDLALGMMVGDVAFSPDGDHLAVACVDAVYVYDIEAWQQQIN